MLYTDLTKYLISSFYKVHSVLGQGLLEAINMSLMFFADNFNSKFNLSNK